MSRRRTLSSARASDPGLRRWVVATLLLVAAMFGGARADDGRDAEAEEPFARGFGYLGAFFVTGARTEARVFSEDLPLGARLNIEEDLGVRDSFTVPRMTLGWRFGKRHILTGGYYDLGRDGVKRLERTIELPNDIEFLVSAEVASNFTVKVGKVQYTYLFHRDDKVTLGIGGGLFVARLGVGIKVTGEPGPAQQEATALDESVSAPLPVFGLRLTYKISPKWGVLASSDWFLVNYDSRYKGVLSDTQIYAAHRTFKHVGFAGGINMQTFGIEFDDDDLLWQLDAGFVGILGAVTFYF